MNRRNELANAIAKVLAGTSLAALLPHVVVAQQAEVPEVATATSVTVSLPLRITVDLGPISAGRGESAV